MSNRRFVSGKVELIKGWNKCTNRSHQPLINASAYYFHNR